MKYMMYTGTMNYNAALIIKKRYYIEIKTQQSNKIGFNFEIHQLGN